MPMTQLLANMSRGLVEASEQTRSVHIGLDKNIDATDAVQFYFFILVVSPIAHTGHVGTSSIVLLVTLGEHNIFIKAVRQTSTLVRLDPRIVVKAAFDITAFLVTMEPNICNP